MKRSIAPHRMLVKLEGEGVEIGAFRSPQFLPFGRVRYVDSLTREESLRYFPEAMLGVPVVRPDVVAPADRLDGIRRDELDFVVASHLLEHTVDPLAALAEWHRVLRPGGLLFLALPDMRGTSDRDRERTTLAHLIEDHRIGVDGPGRRERDHPHYLEWARCVNGLDDPGQAELWADLLERTRLAIHFHCWIPDDVEPMLRWLAENEGVSFRIEDRLDGDGEEFFFLMRAVKAP